MGQESNNKKFEEIAADSATRIEKLENPGSASADLKDDIEGLIWRPLLLQPWLAANAASTAPAVTCERKGEAKLKHIASVSQVANGRPLLGPDQLQKILTLKGALMLN